MAVAGLGVAYGEPGSSREEPRENRQGAKSAKKSKKMRSLIMGLSYLPGRL